MARLKASRQAKLYRTKGGENNPSEVMLNRIRNNLPSQLLPLKGSTRGFVILKLQPEFTKEPIWGGVF